MKRGQKQPKMIPNPFYCERCEGRGFLVLDAEWEPYPVRCPDCEKREATSFMGSHGQ